MQHILFKQKVKTERRDEYIEAHRNSWPELLEALKESGVEREIIWMDGDYIFIYVMAEDFDGAIDNQKKTDVFQKWIEKMTPLLAEIQDYSDEGRVQGLEKVFDLEVQLSAVEKDAGSDNGNNG